MSDNGSDQPQTPGTPPPPYGQPPAEQQEPTTNQAPAPESATADDTQATPTSTPTQPTPSAPYGSPYGAPPAAAPPTGAPSYQPYGQQPGQQSAPAYGQQPGQQPATPYGAPAGYQQAPPSGNPYGQPAQGQAAPYGQQPQYNQGQYNQGQYPPAQQGQYNQGQYAPGQQGQYAQPYGQAQYGAPSYAGAEYGQTGKAPSAPLSLSAKIPAIGLIAASLLGIIGSFLVWAKLTFNMPVLGNGDIEATVTGMGQVGIVLPSDSSVMRQAAERVQSGGADGWFVVVVGVIVIVLAVLRILGKIPLAAAIAGVIGGLIVTGIAAVDMARRTNVLDELKHQAESLGVGLTATVSIGPGLWIALVAGIFMLGSGVLALIRRR